MKDLTPAGLTDNTKSSQPHCCNPSPCAYTLNVRILSKGSDCLSEPPGQKGRLFGLSPFLTVNNPDRAEFITLISSEANELCDKEKRSTLMPEHVLAALEVSLSYA